MMRATLTLSDKFEMLLQRVFTKRDAPAETARYDLKMNTLKLAQSFAANQLLIVKRQLNSLHLQGVSWAEVATSMYLVGAVDFIGKQQNCSVEDRKQLIRLILKSHLGISTEKSIFFFNEALHRQAGSDSDLIVRAGAKAAKQWLDNSKVSAEFSLHEQLGNWGVLA